MPVFVNEVIITGEIAAESRPASDVATAQPMAWDPVQRERLVEEIAGEVFRRLERTLDRITER